MLQAAPHAIHFKCILNFDEGQHFFFHLKEFFLFRFLSFSLFSASATKARL